MPISRRAFIISGLAAGGGLAIGFSLREDDPVPYPHLSTSDFQPNAWLQVTPESEIIFQVHKQEMGQGIMTGLTTVVAEELNVSPESITREFSGVHPDYLNPQFDIQITNASSSMITCYDPIREAAATVRMLLAAAAAKDWNVPVAEVETRDARVYHRASGQQANYGDLVNIARDLPIPDELEFKPRSQYEYVGKFNRRLEAVEKVTGKAVYGIDAAPENSLAAVVIRCPHFGGTLKSFDAGEARNMQGVLEVAEIDSGIAVVATHYWYARQAANRLEVEWDPGEFGAVSSESIARDQRQALDEAEQEAGLAIADNSISAEYSAGFMAHACMEPINATVAITEAQVDVWVSNQAPDIMQAAVAQALGRPVEDVVVHGVYLGGGFGRKFIPDAAVEAAQLAQQMGKPVRVIWSREDDMRNDNYRPSVTCRIYGELDNRSVKEWRYRVCGPSLVYKLIQNIRPVVVPGWMPDAVVNTIAKMEAGKDHENIEGVAETPYLFGDVKVDQIIQNNGIPVSYWRSVGHSFNCFFVEGFVDEMAHQAQVESLEFRRNHLAPESTGRKMLELAAEKASWGTVVPGHFQGIALDQIKGAVVALVAEVSVRNNSIQVHKLVCAADVGLQINPDIIKTVIESCLVWGMSACLHDEITIANGSVQQSNFHDYAIHRLQETPEMEIHLVESDRHPVGVGECAVSPVAPAIANAVFKATRKRLRSLPLKI